MDSSTTIAIQMSAKKAKMGRPPIGDRAAKLHAMRLPDKLLDELDAYAERNGGKTRSEAIRELLQAALKADARRGTKSGRPAKRKGEPR
jgi:hypothetical protein